MFVNPKELKKLMKEAFKANYLIVGRREDVYYIQGVYWKVLCKKEFVPKEILGAVIELTGEIPGDGECYCAGKEGNQMELNPMEIVIPDQAEEVVITDFILKSKHGVLQRIIQFPGSMHVYLINNKFAEMVSEIYCDEKNGEFFTDDPVCSVDHGVFWENNVMKFQVLFREDLEHESTLMKMCIYPLWKKDGDQNV